jgi:isocitrate/isopropylmalate dehydrogenase
MFNCLDEAQQFSLERSFGMALRWSLNRADLDSKLMQVVTQALKHGARTCDLGGTHSTAEMGTLVIEALTDSARNNIVVPLPGAPSYGTCIFETQ